MMPLDAVDHLRHAQIGFGFAYSYLRRSVLDTDKLIQMWVYFKADSGTHRDAHQRKLQMRLPDFGTDG